jgi:RNA polymerase sigma-70 factor (ECF subfamily)
MCRYLVVVAGRHHIVVTELKEQGWCRTCPRVKVMDFRSARFEVVARELIEPLRRFLFRRTDSATAEDVLSEVLLICWRRFDEMPTEPLPWAYGVARHCLANAVRAGRRHHRLLARIASVDPPQATIRPEIDADERIAVALRALRSSDAELLRLWAWEDLSPREIAVVLGLSVNAATIRLHRARQRLGIELERAGLRKTGRPAGYEESTEGKRA